MTGDSSSSSSPFSHKHKRKVSRMEYPVSSFRRPVVRSSSRLQLDVEKRQKDACILSDDKKPPASSAVDPPAPPFLSADSSVVHPVDDDDFDAMSFHPVAVRDTTVANAELLLELALAGDSDVPPQVPSGLHGSLSFFPLVVQTPTPAIKSTGRVVTPSDEVLHHAGNHLHRQPRQVADNDTQAPSRDPFPVLSDNVLLFNDDAADQLYLSRCPSTFSAAASPCDATTGTKNSVTNGTHTNYAESKWNMWYGQLQQFHSLFGHCRVPQKCYQFPGLRGWVKVQRSNFRNKVLPEDRRRKLECLGFVWSAHADAWERHYKMLVVFKQKYGHTNVSSRYTDMPGLATWVKTQRRQYKISSEPNDGTRKIRSLSPYRVDRLNELGFLWAQRTTPAVAVTTERQVKG